MQMTRAARFPRASSARVIALLTLAVGVSVSACTGTPAEGGHDHDSSAAHDTHAGDEGAAAGDDHDHDDHDHDEEFPTGPPRPADPDLACGPTVLSPGQQVVRYCGEGGATFTVGDDKETEVEGGLCEDRDAIFLIHFGANYSDPDVAAGDYVGVALRDMPEEAGPAPIYALELTLDGWRTQVGKADVEVSFDGDMLEMELVGELADGRPLTITGSCEVTAG